MLPSCRTIGHASRASGKTHAHPVGTVDCPTAVTPLPGESSPVVFVGSRPEYHCGAWRNSAVRHTEDTPITPIAECRACGIQARAILVTHHVIPVELGGKDTLANLVTLCPNCHRRADRGEIDKKALRVLFGQE